MLGDDPPRTSSANATAASGKSRSRKNQPPRKIETTRMRRTDCDQDPVAHEAVVPGSARCETEHSVDSIGPFPGTSLYDTDREGLVYIGVGLLTLIAIVVLLVILL
jgi:hypothetical protein